MAIQTFTSGQILTAADTNTYLANSGLVYVTSATIGSAVSSVTVTGAFSTTYDNYRIILNGSTGTGTYVRFALGTATADYFGSFFYDNYAGASSGYVRSSAALFLTVGAQDGSKSTSTQFDVLSPFLSQRTNLSGTYGGANTGFFGGVNITATSFTSFVLSTNSGTLTDGTISVYGYRKA
jgi:hypothetical protein